MAKTPIHPRFLVLALLSSLLMTLLLSAPTTAATASTISGTIVDQNGLPAPWVEVRVGHPGEDTLKTANTNASGHYSITGLAAGTYTMSAGTPQTEYLWGENATAFDGEVQELSVGDGATVTRNAVIQRPVWLKVSVQDSVGAPVNVGIEVAIAGQPTAYCNRAVEHTLDVTSILVVCDRGGSITVTAKGVSTVVDATLGDITPVALTVPAKRKASGRVINSSGNPVSSVELEPRNPNGGAEDPPCGWGGPTGKNGKFSLICDANSTVAFDVTTRSLSYIDRTLKVSVGTVNKSLGDIKLATAAKAQVKVIKNTGKKLTNGPCLEAYRKSGGSWIFTETKSSSSTTTRTVGGLKAGTYKFLAAECYPDWSKPSPSPTPSHERKWVNGGKAYKLRAGHTVKLPTTKLRPAYDTKLSITEIAPPGAPGGAATISVRVTASGTSAGPTGRFEFEVEHPDGDDVAIFTRSLSSSKKGRLTVTVPADVTTGPYDVRVWFRGTGRFRDVRFPVDQSFVVP